MTYGRRKCQSWKMKMHDMEDRHINFRRCKYQSWKMSLIIAGCPNISYGRYQVSSPRTIPPGQLPPTNSPLDNSPPGQFPPRVSCPLDNSPLVNSPPGQFPPRSIAPQDNCSLDSCPPCLFPPRTIPPLNPSFFVQTRNRNNIVCMLKIYTLTNELSTTYHILQFCELFSTLLICT